VALSTPRLVLRPFTPGDVDDLLSMDGDARVMRYIGTGLGPRTRDEVAASIGRIVAFAAEHPGMSLLHASTRDEGRFVGGCGLFPLPDLVSKDRTLASVLKWTHYGLNSALFALVLVHVIAALKHHFIDRDGTLARMLPVAWTRSHS